MTRGAKSMTTPGLARGHGRAASRGGLSVTQTETDKPQKNDKVEVNS